MRKSDVNKALKPLGYKVVTFFKSKESGGILAHVTDGSEVYMLYVNPRWRHATMQMLSNICVHEPWDINDWFWRGVEA